MTFANLNDKIIKKRGAVMNFTGVEKYEVNDRAGNGNCRNGKVCNVIEKWYKKLEFPKEYDAEFYDALDKYDICDDIDISDYDLNETDGKRNLLSFLFMCEKLCEQYRSKGIDENIMVHTAKDIVLWTNAWSEVKGEMYLGELNWLSNHFNMRLFRLGNLEFMLKKFHTDFPEFSITKDDYLIDVHIPNDAKFRDEDCEESFRMAKEFFKKHYPDLELKYFTCESWLLDRELNKLLPETSNIIRFGRRFEVIPQETTEDYAALRYVFKWDTTRFNLENAVCSSGFSERLKKHVLSGEKLYSVTGVFPVDEI